MPIQLSVQKFAEQLLGVDQLTSIIIEEPNGERRAIDKLVIDNRSEYKQSASLGYINSKIQEVIIKLE